MVKKVVVILVVLVIVLATWFIVFITPLIKSGTTYDRLIREAKLLPECADDDQVYFDFFKKHHFNGPNSLGEYVSPEYEKFELVSITLNRLAITIENQKGRPCISTSNYYGFKWSLFGGL